MLLTSNEILKVLEMCIYIYILLQICVKYYASN
jgi:hypothetical protein